jgi:hypothetical protein
MAISWDVSYQPVSVDSKIVNIIGVVTDDTSSAEPITVRVEKISIATPAEECKALDLLYSRYQAELIKAGKIATWLAGKELAAVKDLEARN